MAAVITPLTTIFTPPPDCLASVTESDSYLYLGIGASCIPSGTVDGLATYFSPALRCPSGWTSADGTQVTAGTVTETRATCCPVLSYLSNFNGDNYMYADPEYGCTAWIYGPVTATVLPTTASPATTTISYNSLNDTGTLWAYTVQLAWQATDLLPSSSSSLSSSSAIATTTTTSSSPTSSLPSTTSAIATAASTTGSHASSSSGGLSTTAKIAIGVVVPVVVLAAFIFLGFCIFKRRKDKKRVSRREIQQEIVQGGGGAGSIGQPEPMSRNEKYGSPQIAYAPLRPEHHSESGRESQRWSHTDHTYVDHAPDYSNYSPPNLR